MNKKGGILGILVISIIIVIVVSMSSSNNEFINITSVNGKVLQNESKPQEVNMFSCTHCGFITQYQVELNVHMRIHYL